MNSHQRKAQHKARMEDTALLESLGVTIDNRYQFPDTDEMWPNNAATEAEVEAEVIAALKEEGFHTPEDWIKKKRIPKNGQGFYWRTIQKRNTTISKGLGDIIVGFAYIPLIVGLELKKRTTRRAKGSMIVSGEQLLSVGMGNNYLIRSGMQAKHAIQRTWDEYA